MCKLPCIYHCVIELPFPNVFASRCVSHSSCEGVAISLGLPRFIHQKSQIRFDTQLPMLRVEDFDEHNDGPNAAQPSRQSSSFAKQTSAVVVPVVDSDRPLLMTLATSVQHKASPNEPRCLSSKRLLHRVYDELPVHANQLEHDSQPSTTTALETPVVKRARLRKVITAIALTFGVFSCYGTAITVNASGSTPLMFFLFLLGIGRCASHSRAQPCVLSCCC